MVGAVEAEVTVKVTPLLATPPTVIITFPDVAPDGTGATMLVEFQLVGEAAVPLNMTVLVPCDAPKLVPVMVTDVPTGPEVGLRSVMLGAAVVTVNAKPLLPRPPTVTTTFPDVAPDGTGATMLVEFQLVGEAAVPLNMTALVPCDAPKLVPVIVTEVPAGPEVGFRLEMAGAGGLAVTVKVKPLLATPPAVTMMLPEVAADGTGTTMLDALQLDGVATVPSNVTVVVSCAEPKFVPVIVTELPTGPDVGLKPVIVGGVEAVPPAGFTATSTAPQLSELLIDALADAGPAADWICSSAISLVFGSAGT